MALTSTSTLDDVKAAYRDNADYQETGSTAKAKAFVTACEHLLLLLPRNVSQGGDSLGLDTSLIRDRLRRAERWVSVHSKVEDGGAGARFFGFQGFRG